MKKVASLRYGVIFKKAFSQPAIFTAFAQDFLGVTLNIDRVEMDKALKPVVGSVERHFDLFVEDKVNHVIVSLQHVHSSEHYERFLHSHCVALLEYVATKKNYSPDISVFTLVVLTSADRHRMEMATIDFDPKNLAGHSLGEIKHKILYLYPKYVSKNTPQPYRQWLEAMNDSFDGNVDETRYAHPSIQALFKRIGRELISPQELAQMKDEYYFEEERQQKYLEGLKKGREREKIIIAEKMLKEGLEHTLIQRVTGVPLAMFKVLKTKAS